MITPARGGKGFLGLQKEGGGENCAPPRSGLVQLWFSRSAYGTTGNGSNLLIDNLIEIHCLCQIIFILTSAKPEVG
jgi:hypothetical protein